MTKTGKIASAAAAALLLGGMAAQAAPYFYWNGSVSTNWHDAGNWTIDYRGSTATNQTPTLADVAYIETYGDNLPTLSTAEAALTLRVAYLSGSLSELNIVDGADLTVAANYDRVGLAGDGTVNQSGGTVEFNRMQLGAGATGTGVYNLSGGTFKIKSSATLGGQANASLTMGELGPGTFNLSGGTVVTAGGIVVGSADAGTGYFNVFGSGVVSNGNSYTANSGYWYQNAQGQLSATIDSDNGFSLGQIILGAGSNDNPSVTFQYGATLDVGFSGVDMGDATNSWDLISWPTNTVVTDNGLAFSTNVDLDVWSFAVTNNALRITYGIGSDPVVVTNPPPSGPRSLYWTGNGSDTSATNAANWDVDFSGTNTATWGVYSGDTIYVGHDSLNAEDSVSESTFDGLLFADQNRLHIGRGRTGIVHFVAGELTLPKPSSGASSYIGWNSSAGNGTLNQSGGTLSLYGADVGAQGAQGALNLTGGDLLLPGRVTSSGGTSARASLWVGSNYGTGTVHIAGGSLKTLLGVVLGDTYGTGTFCVEGSGASEISLGSTRSDYDGYWAQYAGSTLKIRIDEGGVTPIQIQEDGSAKDVSHLDVYGADVFFEEGAILDVDWMDGVTKYGAFDIMTFSGSSVSNGGLAFASSVDTDIWEFAFVDADGDSTNDTLRVTAPKGTAANGTPLWWLYSNGLTEADEGLDADNDGMDNWEEYVAGTSPTNAASVLEVNAFAQDGTNYVIRWQSIAGKTYSVKTGESVLSMSGVEASGIAGAAGETSHTGTVSSSGTVFYKVEVQ